MNKKSRKVSESILKMVLWLCGLCVILPLILIAVWSVAARWPWPLILPEDYTLRGIEAVLLSGAVSREVLFSSIIVSLAVAVICVIIGMMTARAVVYYDFFGKRFLHFCSVLPVIVPSTVFAMGIHILFIRMGLSDNVWGVILVHIICSLPYAVKLLTDSTRALGKKLEEQARVLGAGPFYAFFRISLPAMAPAVLTSLCMAYIVSFSQYFITLMIGGGSFKSLAVIMVPYLQNGDRTIAASYSVVFLVVSIIVFAFFERITKLLNPQEAAEFYQ